ncbi:MAG: hypothetical protein AB7D39_20780 [Pseudodesulfovibrio sp.]|uniref:hypothetical protein n=1 Tax=Pseudodesulfovibrio sp. TaxID=2035812 RepID=UPI003D0C96A8
MTVQPRHVDDAFALYQRMMNGESVEFGGNSDQAAKGLFQIIAVHNALVAYEKKEIGSTLEAVWTALSGLAEAEVPLPPSLCGKLARALSAGRGRGRPNLPHHVQQERECIAGTLYGFIQGAGKAVFGADANSSNAKAHLATLLGFADRPATIDAILSRGGAKKHRAWAEEFARSLFAGFSGLKSPLPLPGQSFSIFLILVVQHRPSPKARDLAQKMLDHQPGQIISFNLSELDPA